MPIAIACPSCKARLQAPDSAVGKRVKCPKCQTPIPVPDAGDSPAPAKQSAPPPSKAPAKKSAPANDFNFDDDDDRPVKKSAPAKRRDDDYDDEDDRPAPKKNGGIKKSRDDDDYDDDRPSKKGAVKKGRDDDYDDEPPRKGKGKPDRDDYDDEDDDRPRKKGKKGRPVGNFPTPTQEDMSNAFNMYLFAFIANLIVGGAGAIVFLVMWFTKRKESPLVDWHGKQVINTWISSILAMFLFGALACAGGMGFSAISQDMAMVGGILAFLFMGLAFVYALYCGILFLIGMFKAKGGEYWRFPGVWQLLK